VNSLESLKSHQIALTTTIRRSKMEKISSPRLKDVISDKNVPDQYNEFEQEEDTTTPLRTIVEFELFDTVTGKLVTFDELGDLQRKISARAILFEPFPRTWRETILNILSTSPSDVFDIGTPSPIKTSQVNAIAGEEGTTNSAENIPSSKLDWETLKIGDFVDGYCNKTFKWYEAKIVLIFIHYKTRLINNKIRAWIK
jgi:hypothetical protein